MRGKLGSVSRVRLPRVAMLLHMDGTNGSTTFTDSSLNALSVTRSSDTSVLPTISTTFARTGFGAHGFFPVITSGANIGQTQGAKLTAVSDDFVFGNDDFTIECFFRLTNLNDYRGLFGSSNTSAAGGIQCYFAPSGAIGLAGTSGSTFLGTPASTVVVNTWYHIAVCRIAGVTTLFLDGTVRGVYSDSSASYSQSNYTSNTFLVGNIGQTYSGLQSFGGSIDEFRVFSKFGVYSTPSFVRPSAPFPNP